MIDLLRIAGAHDIDASELEVDVLDSELTEAKPSVRRADLVLRIRAAGGQPRQLVVFEVQRARDESKRFSWPLYLAYLHARHRVPVSLVVYCFDADVAQWASEPRPIGANMVLTASVVGPEQLPPIGSIEEVSARPHLAVLSALGRLGARDERSMHRHAAGVVRVFEALLRSGRPPNRNVYLSLLHGTAHGRLRSKLEGLAKEYEMGAALDIIFNDGKKEGRAEGEAEALLTVLRARKLQVDAATKARVLRTRNLRTLQRWLTRAVTAESVDEVFGEKRSLKRT